MDYFDGMDGTNGSPDEPKDIKRKLETLKDDDRLDIKSIKGVDKLAKDIKGSVDFSQTATEYQIDGIKKANGMLLNFKQGTNITMTGSPTAN